LLLLGPSYRRNLSNEAIPAINRYDGLFVRIARKYTEKQEVDIVLMLDDLTLVNGSTRLPYIRPEGVDWKSRSFSDEVISKAMGKNTAFLRKKLRNNKYSEIFLAMGKGYAQAIPDSGNLGVQVVFPATGGIGPKAVALIEWLKKNSKSNTQNSS
jgi:hypothetical protein